MTGDTLTTFDDIAQTLEKPVSNRMMYPLSRASELSGKAPARVRASFSFFSCIDSGVLTDPDEESGTLQNAYADEEPFGYAVSWYMGWQ